MSITLVAGVAADYNESLPQNGPFYEEEEGTPLEEKSGFGYWRVHL